MLTVLFVPMKSDEMSNTTPESCGSEHKTTAVGDLTNFARLPASGQARMLRERIDGEAFASMFDTEIAEPISQMTPEAWASGTLRTTRKFDARFASRLATRGHG